MVLCSRTKGGRPKKVRKINWGTVVELWEKDKPAQNAERERRAAIARAEGGKRSIELKADAELCEAEKQAEAVKVAADAEAYSIKIKADADAEQTRVVAEAIKNDGQPAINFEIMKRQVDGISELIQKENLSFCAKLDLPCIRF